jgi:AcrR family transcriptional regulator
MPVTAPKKAEASRRRILDAAAGLFRRKGYAAVSLRDIATATGMQVGSLYYHFDSKEQIVAEILDIGIALVHDGVRAAVDALPADAAAGDILRTAIRAHLLALLEFSDYTSANVRIFGQVPDDVRRANLTVRRAYEATWDGLLRRTLPTGTDLSAARLLVIGALNATLEWFDPTQGSVEALAERYAGLLLHGLLAGKAGG